MLPLILCIIAFLYFFGLTGVGVVVAGVFVLFLILLVVQFFQNLQMRAERNWQEYLQEQEQNKGRTYEGKR